MTPKVSVVVATNRVLPFLTQALASASAQSFTGWRGVVVDDGSPDGEEIATIVARFPQFRLVRVPPRGVGPARNTGVAETSGELIAFLDDDDLWPPDWLERHVAAHRLHPGAVVSYAGTRSIGTEGEELFQSPSKQVDCLGLARREVSLFTGTLVIRRSAFVAAGGFNPLFRRAQDLDLVLRASRLGDFVHVPDVLLGYRTHPYNSTRQQVELASTIDRILRLHRDTARFYGDHELARALQFSMNSNARFRLWGARQRIPAHLRRRDLRALILDLGSVVPSLPRAVRSRIQGGMLKG